MALGQHVEVVAALNGVECVRAKIGDDEQVDGEELAKLGLAALLESRVLEGLEHVVVAQSESVIAERDVAEDVSENPLADAYRTYDCDATMGLDEAERDVLGRERLVELHLRGPMPALELDVGIERCPLRAQCRGRTVAPLQFVGEDQKEKSRWAKLESLEGLTLRTCQMVPGCLSPANNAMFPSKARIRRSSHYAQLWQIAEVSLPNSLSVLLLVSFARRGRALVRSEAITHRSLEIGVLHRTDETCWRR